MARKKVDAPGLFGPVLSSAAPPTNASSAQRSRPRKTSETRSGVSPAGSSADSIAAITRLEALVARLEETVREIPRAAEFEPLAEHIYSFAQSGPKLMESLEAVKAAVPQIEAARRALSDTATTLQDTNQRLAESLMRLPSAGDYEPLAAPLVEFTRVSPALTETMRDAVKSFSVVRETVTKIEAAARSMSQVAAAVPRGGRAPKAEVSDVAAGVVAESLETLANEVDSVLVKLPKDPEYARVADQLKELATVSPSLMEWMAEVKPLAAPLAGSVVTLRRVANTLRENASRLRGDAR